MIGHHIAGQDAYADLVALPQPIGQALRDRTLACAALDVFKPEPLPSDSDLWDLDNLLILPHVAGGTQLEGHYIADIFGENLGRFIRDELPLRNQVDKIRGF